MRVSLWSFRGALGISRLIMGPNFVKTVSVLKTPLWIIKFLYNFSFVLKNR